MKITFTRQNKNLWFKAENETGNKAHIDGPEQNGGEGRGMRPMEMLLASFAGCAAFDFTLILEKQKLNADHLAVEISGERETKIHVTPFTKIDLVFRVAGDIPQNKAERAAQLAVEKYCSVQACLHPDIVINHTVQIQNK